MTKQKGVSMFDFIQNADWFILNGIHNTFSCGFLDFLMPKITVLGDVGAIWLLAGLLLSISKKYRKYGLALIIGLVLSFLVSNVFLKPLIARPRPCWTENVNLLINNPSDYLFPSGHTLASVIGAFVITAANRKFGIFAIPIAVLISFSRLYLYVHFPSDVLTSVVLGIGIGALAVFTAKKATNIFDGVKSRKLNRL